MCCATIALEGRLVAGLCWRIPQDNGCNLLVTTSILSATIHPSSGSSDTELTHNSDPDSPFSGLHSQRGGPWLLSYLFRFVGWIEIASVGRTITRDLDNDSVLVRAREVVVSAWLRIDAALRKLFEGF